MERITDTIYALIATKPIIVGVLIALAYAYRAAGRWSPTMVVDGALLALYIWRPSAGSLAFGIFLAAVRHVATLSGEIARLFKLDSYDGWTLRAILFMLPALDHYTEGSQPRVADIPPPAVGPTAILDPVELPPLTPAEWLGWANDDETAPMLAAIGPTRSGKTTWVLSVLSRRKGQFVITTPKSKETDPWGGFPAIRLRIDLPTREVDWKPIARAVEQVHFEMIRRNAQGTIAQEDWLTLVVDEYSTTVAKVPEVRQYVLDLWLMGASAKIRVVAIAPEINVKAWGIEGRGDVRENLLFAKVAPDRTVQMGRIDPQGRLLAPRRLDTRPVPQLAAQAQMSFRVWSGFQKTDRVGGGFASAPVPPATQTPQTQTTGQTGRLPMATDTELLDLLGKGFKRREAADRLQQQGKGLDNNRWAKLRRQRYHGKP